MPHNVASFLADQSSLQPNGSALRAPVGRYGNGDIRYESRTFLELERDASATAFYLDGCGVKRGTRVLLMVKPGLDLVRIVFALFKIGAVPIVIDPGMGVKSFLTCVRLARPEVVVGISVAVWMSRIFRSSFRRLRARVLVGRSFGCRITENRSRGQFQVADSGVDELAAVLFTSGSTGPAKGVRYTHGMFAAQVVAIRDQYQIQPGEVDLPMLPVFALFNPALGMCTVVPEMNPSRPATVDPRKIIRAIQQNRVTNSFGSPALWTKISRHCQAHSITLPSIRRILMAGAPVPPGLMCDMRAIIPNGEIHTPYGATEALPVSSISSTEVLGETKVRTEEGQGTCVGMPLSQVRVRVIEPVEGPVESGDAANDLPMGQIGEIIVRGPSVTRSYDKLPEVDRLTKIVDGKGHWHRMGDMGWLDEKGRLWFCGRKVERVLTAKGPLYTDCCEAIFNQHPRVFRSALIDVGNGEPAIVVEPESGQFPKGKTSQDAFRQELRELAQTHSFTSSIGLFYFEKSFPVDVRHNAKIHRLTLSTKYRESA